MERAAALPHRPRPDAPASLPAQSTKRQLKLLVTLVVLAAAVIDWTQPPRQQWSVRLYDFAVIKAYRSLLHPITSKVSRCRFQPTCSRYSEEAMHSHGFPHGLLLTIWRLMRCGPWVTPHTLDPVPN
jgi:putative membrane protein insertion efficiency factor